jgi:capsular polysaccharide transport system ATP-binding protein
MYLSLEKISKRYRVRNGLHTVLNNVSTTIHAGDKLGILGRNGAGKSTLIRILSGQELPDSGRVVRRMKVSWPLAFSGGFQGSLTGLDNLRFLARIYASDAKRIQGFVEDFAELGKHFREPVKTYSSGMQARLAFGLSLAFEFDCYLVDEVIAVGDSRFHAKCMHELFTVRADRTFIFVSHDAGFIKAHCRKAAVLNNGIYTAFPDTESAYEYYLSSVH